MGDNSRLRLLGPARLEREGQAVPGLETGKPLALLGYLVVQNRPFSREYLADLFWRDMPEERGRANLSWTLHKISSLLPECLQADRHTVCFQRTEGCWLDLEAFEELAAAGDARALAQAVDLYQGDLMQGLSLDDSADFELWLVGERERWQQRLVWALGELVAHHGRRGEYALGIDYARRLLALEPWQEEMHRELMRLLALSGQRGAALVQYETCCHVLAEELDVEPADETVALYEGIKAGEIRPLPAPATPSPARPKHNLPPQLTPFVGREGALVEIAQLLQDPTCRLLTLIGPGGSGKTRLALEAAAGQLDHYSHGVFFVSLAPLDAADILPHAVAQAIGFRFYEGGEPREQLLEYLSEKRMLLLLDNYEHLLAPTPESPPQQGAEGGAGLVVDTLRTAPEVQILATSRAPLNVLGEHRFLVHGMDVPDPESDKGATLPQAEEISRYSAVRLFLQSARQAQPAFALTADNAAHVARICRLVAGMPLGILLAAAWVGILAPAEIAEQISDEIGSSLDFLESDVQDVPRRQRSMRAVFDHSWNLLNTRQREVMQALSVFRGGFTHQAAQHVTGASLRELRALVDRSLLGRDARGRYETHELLRQYAAGYLTAVPEEWEAAQDRHCAYYVDVLQQSEAALLGRDQRKALQEIEAEFENVRVAWNWALAQGKIEALDHALEGLAEFLYARHWLQQGEEIFAKAAQELARAQPGIAGPPEVKREARIVLGKVLLRQGQFCVLLGYHEKASELLQQSLAISRDLRASREIAWALVWLGYIAVLPEEGKRLCLEGLALFEELGDQTGRLYAHWSLKCKAAHEGMYAEEEQLVQECLAIARELGNPSEIAWYVSDLGWANLNLGDYGRAIQLHQEALQLHEQLGDSWGMGWALFLLALDAWGLQQYDKAKQHLQESLAIRREVGIPTYVAQSLEALGDLANAQGEYAEAMRLARECLALSEKHGFRDMMANCDRVLGEALCGLGDLRGATRHFRQVLKVFPSLRGRWKAQYLELLPPIAVLLSAEGKKERALELLALVLHHPATLQWTKDRAAALAANLEAELAPDVAVAAWELGRARDLDATLAELLAELRGQG